MTKKKKEIIIDDDELELITPEVEWKMGMDSLKAMAEAETKFKKEAFKTPVKFIRERLVKTAMFINILIKRLDSNYHDVNKFANCEDWHGAHIFKDIQVKYTGDERDKEITLFYISQCLTNLDYITWRLYENEALEMKEVNQEKLIEEYYKRENKEFNEFCKESKYHQEYYKPESEDKDD